MTGFCFVFVLLFPITLNIPAELHTGKDLRHEELAFLPRLPRFSVWVVAVWPSAWAVVPVYHTWSLLSVLDE